ncbi:MAG: D-2-hydroxyacid dehydrogenase family protein [Rhodospirillaceae bacterium]|nr:D-2-hydroxyacid dehydrogenase family protein [Rhodospirillaceae bacterium]MBT5297750.1 D-2-hydroxyacid dehydrogenase family protein [Rhodospirillaceae bacterium]MBT6607533.1 D-2-hydroxyacid dehydrogenase family protein [Rhodospirillaceae bacterium]MBT6886139.1 D-2-hydroxyacid dehydrogenase family protein [Rhodospirillaceae bacterium]MBT7250457.1 D-2-hydroxyacid dehydrogenase family protein [Rhodospirillaceae bacterium]
MTRIAILDDYQNKALGAADWDSIPGADVTVFNEFLGHDEVEIANTLAPFNVLIAMRERTRFPASQIELLANLELLVTTGMRNLAIDMDAARAQDVDVCGTDMLGYPAFEHAWALILALVKEIPKEDRAMKAGGWQEGFGVGLNGKTLGVVGLGKLGAQAAKVGLAFGMDVIAWSQNLTDERCTEVGVRRVTKEELFSTADVITVHMILSERSTGLVGATEFAQMKPSAFLVNTSRGPIVDETALIEALESQRIAGAGIDVYDVEPLPADHALRGFDNAVLTGHTGYVISELYDKVYGQAVENVRAWLDGAPVRLLNGE